MPRAMRSGSAGSTATAEQPSRHILVVDDDRPSREGLSAALRHAGHSVDSAADAWEAIVQLRAYSFDIAVVDLDLPAVHGVDLGGWDTHNGNFTSLKTKLPEMDKAIAALVSDLVERGMYQDTAIIWMGEFGRTPRINGNAGRDHWTNCYSVVFAGAGIRGGTVYGESDDQAAYVQDLPVSTSDICATIYHCLGIDPEARVPDAAGRPTGIDYGGRPIEGILV